MKPYLTMGLTVLAGAALFEVALVPGILIGGAAVLAPKYLLRDRGQRRQPSRRAMDRRPEPRRGRHNCRSGGRGPSCRSFGSGRR